MNDPRNVFNLVLFIVLGAFIVYLWVLLLLHKPAKGNDLHRRRGGGGEPRKPSPDYNPYTGEEAKRPIAQALGANDRPGHASPPMRQPMPNAPRVTQDQYYLEEMKWVQLGRELNATQPAPPEMPAIEVTREFERIKK